MIPRRPSFLCFVLLGLRLAAQIPDAELTQPPTPARLAAIRAAAQRDGWAPHVAPLRAAAVRAYELDRLAAAEAWFHAYRWATLWGMAEGEFTSRWMQALNAAKVAHANMTRTYEMRSVPLGRALAPELQAWVFGNTQFSAAFFGVLTPVDYLPAVFQILDELHRRDPVRFKKYGNLAIAFAVVYDVPPPPDWPHGQVSTEALPRKFPPVAEAFAWWTHQDENGLTYHRLAKLGPDELKFVVDTAAPLAELDWAEKNSHYPLNELARAYTAVKYRVDRITGKTPFWPGRTYKLSEILATGGICVDQGYYATEVGKARGVPTLLFRGPGNDGRHAWFGFLDGNNKWELDAGRYADQRFVTGYARDPQTWGELSDHELQFLSERFRALPSFQQSRVHAMFAADFLAAGNVDAAAAAARKAVNYERRNQDGWETLIAAAQKSGRDPKVAENIMREAALAFSQRNPDLEAYYVNRVATSLRGRGQTSEADAEVRRIANKNRDGRTDLSFAQARDILQRSLATESLEKQVRAYNSVLETYGQGAGIGFFDQVVVGFVEHLVNLAQPAEARRAIERARQTLKVEPGSQLEGEFKRLGQTVPAK